MDGSSDQHARIFDILLVEDSEADIRLLRLALEEATVKCRLHVAKKGDAALTLLRGDGENGGALRPDLILLDLYLPGMDGRSIVQEIKGDECLRDIPVILLTGMSDDYIDESRSMYDGRYVRKPSDRASFNHVVAEIEDVCARIAG